jgi:hypothetical protein
MTVFKSEKIGGKLKSNNRLFEIAKNQLSYSYKKVADYSPTRQSL